MKSKIKSFVATIVAVGMSLSVMSTPVSAGWIKDGKDYYYENSDGSYRTGWIKTSSGDYYYCLKSGKMARDCSVKINGVKYSFDENGKAINKPETTKKTDKTSKSSKTSKKKTSENDESTGAVKNQNTFPGLVTFGVYCGMSEEEFKSLKRFKSFKWDYDVEAYKVDDMYVYVDDGVVNCVARIYGAKYGYYTRSRNYIDSSTAEAKVDSWRRARLKTHKNKEVLLDNSTDSSLSEGETYYYTKIDNVVYCMSDVIWDTTYEEFYAIERYIYLGE
ncbi:MAG: hypothetical protein J6A37_08685 [Oscillospiraceae bacterium]|nr:hypothetical protein [Oscillospiraceae bacterium]MBP1546662.1 hypothetical protein [Oscillospiraceae bacterium]